MRRVFSILTLTCLLLSFGAYSQKTLLIKKPGSAKYFTYLKGDDISLRMTSEKSKIYAIIKEITDSSIIVEGNHEILFEQIDRVYRGRHLLTLFKTFVRYAGVGYFALDGVNRTINKDYPIIQESTLWISAGLVAASFAMEPLKNKVFRIGRPWIFVVLDLPQLPY